MKSGLWHSNTLAFLGIMVSTSVLAGDDVSLVKAMGSLQYFAHKTSLSIDSKNIKLTSFYAHEMEEIIEDIGKIEDFKGYPISELVRNKLLPPFEKLEDSIRTGDWKKIDTQFNQLVEGCNLCHTASDHEYVIIVRPKNNHFMQSFDNIK
ncbi:MAG: hypothetical protein EP315_06160 [Gammaproteobacteria bacterium]|nr:MAG: hypothetical protein EP315_06160 [Gammaproteobacteria bacterium]